MQRDFVLEKRHINEGLTEQDFCDYAGFPVHTFKITDFSFWENACFGLLSPEQGQLRAKEIYAALSNKGISDIRGGPYSFQSAKNAADRGIDAVGAYALPTHIPMNLHKHFRQIAQHGAMTSTNLISVPHQNRFVVFPGVLNETILPTPPRYLKSSAFVMRSSFDRPIDFWSAFSGLPKDRISSSFKTDDAFRLSMDLHELRHIRQVSLPHDPLFTFYLECDSDLFSDAILKKANIGNLTCRSRRHARYASMLSGSTDYWFGPLADSLEKRKKGLTYRRIMLAMTEISFRLTMDALGRPEAAIGADRIQRETLSMIQGTPSSDRDLSNLMISADQYRAAWLGSEESRREPEVAYSLLYQLEKKAVFQGYARQLVRNIIAGAEHFNPALTQVSQPQKKIALPPSLKV